MAEHQNPFERYLVESDMKVSALALRMGHSPSTLIRALKGERNPSIALAKRVESATDGKVTAEQFISVCLDAQRAPTPEGASS